jgi:hypothetical protein
MKKIKDLFLLAAICLLGRPNQCGYCGKKVKKGDYRICEFCGARLP